MKSIHDSLLTGYVVDGRERSVTLHTEPHPGGGDAFIDVVFRGVVAYHFEADCFENIVSEIIQVDPGRVVGDGAGFAERHRMCGWPPEWNPSVETAELFLVRAGARVFELQCSYGMAGWIAAKSIQYTAVGAPA